MQGLVGKRVVLTGSRKIAELSTIVEKLGGIPVSRPAQGTVAVDPKEVELAVGELIRGGSDWIILTTGIGAEMLCQAADRMGMRDQFVNLLKRSNVAARGYKTVKYLRSLGIEPSIRDDDGTTAGLVRALDDHDLTGRRVALQLYGDSAPRLVQWLHDKQADVSEILPYRHVPPELSVVDSLLSEVIERKVDAVTFTSTSQVRFLMAYAREQSLGEQVVSAFTDVIAVAVGKVTAEALREEGISRVITPKEERMGSMIVSLARYFEEDGSASRVEQ
ncbi:uroporphyrinogen-III synthase [Alicyclobacillus dauci]|uniref:Uroporphyrinogen-III synthase n=1 Tax=Alicyclobacillus dauci TaxID=1475485 RepID=A0ABY6Z1B4_9BACL|nr:uroporphyrinogen-III synthase [Alicyclobacillus dauci]WAH36616.1 uroporphyrinogen-III synthase [Alicyclobacillus dauci]